MNLGRFISRSEPDAIQVRLRLRIASESQFYAGLIFALIGAFALFMAAHYPLGTASRMGPGFFPIVVSILLIALGAASCIAGVTTETTDRVRNWPLVPLGFVIAGVVGFGLLIDHGGLVLASGFLMLLSCYQRLRSRPIEAIVLGSGLIVFVCLLFVKLLGLPINLY